MSADIAFYQRAAAFSEFNDCARYRLYIDTLIAPRLMSGLAVSVDATIQHPIQVSLKDLTKATQGFAEPDDYLRVQSCGSFLRTIQLLSYLDRHNNRAAISAHDLRFICEHTIALDILLSEREIEALYELSDEESKPLVAVLALALYKAKSRDEDVDFKFRHSLCQTVLTQFHGKLEEFIVWLLPKTPQIANYLLTILDRQTLQKLYWLIGSADEADRTRQAILIRFCWLEIEPQLQAASKMITVDLVKQVNDSIQVHFSHSDEDEAHRSYKQQLRETVHERLARLGSWFRQPEDGFVNASTRQLGELILVEATDGKITENQPFEWSGDALDIQIDGLSVHRMYDCLFVTLRNALKYGAEDSLIKINVSREAQAVEGVSQIRVP